MSRKKTVLYEKELIESLQGNPEEAVAYLNAALDDGDPKVFLLAVQDVAKAYGGIGELSKKANVNRESLYKTLSEKGNPHFDHMNKLIKTLGFHLVIEAPVTESQTTRKSQKRKTVSV